MHGNFVTDSVICCIIFVERMTEGMRTHAKLSVNETNNKKHTLPYNVSCTTNREVILQIFLYMGELGGFAIFI